MRTRVLTGLVAMAVALAAVLATSPIPAAVLLVLLCLAGGREAFKLAGQMPYADVIVLLVALVILGLGATTSALFLILLSSFWIVGTVCLIVWKPDVLVATTGLVLWIASGAGAGMALQLQSIGSNSMFGANLLLMALIPLWVGDSMAYFVGKKWGRHKLAPSISPNKTVEGAVANLVGCVVAGWALGTWLGVPIPASIAVGLSAGVFGQVGDLLQSRLKRAAGVKDSGSLLPGHGGVLDRMDSFLFSSVPSLMLLLWLAPELFHVKHWPF